MFQYYYLYENELPTEAGFPLFGLIHIIWLTVIVVFGFFAVKMYKNAAEGDKIKYEKMMVVSMVGLDLYKYAVLIVTGNFNVWELPLNMCGLAVYISCIHAFTHTKTTREILYYLCMPGALAALLFPNWNYYPQINFINIHSFLIHALIVIYSLMLLFNGRLRPNIRYYIRVWIFLAVVVPVAWFVNQICGTNFLFLRVPSPESPLVSIYNVTGAKLYLLGYAFIVLVVNMMMYVPFALRDLRKKVAAK